MSIAEKFETVADRVYEKAQKNTTDDFIRRITNNGTRTNCCYAFAFGNFSGFTFPLKPKGIGNMFYHYQDETIPDGIDCSNASVTGTSTTNSPAYLCAYSKLKYFPDINIPPAHYWYASFRDCTELETIEVIRMCEGSGASTNLLFYNCKSLKNIKFEGVIPISISFADCPLTVESMKSIISCLKDYSQSDDPDDTLTFNDDCWRRLEASGSAPDGDTWENYVIKRGWLIG